MRCCGDRGGVSLRMICFAWLFVTPLVVSCGTTSRLHPFDAPPGSLRLAEVVGIVPGSQVQVQHKPLYEVLAASGMSETTIREGAVGAGRAYCCWGPNERENAIFFFVPKGVTLDAGDIVEVRMGRPPGGNDSGTVNMATIVRQKRGDPNGQCRWDPPRDGLWNKVLYCDWMKDEGWVRHTGAVYNIWYRIIR